MIQIQLIITNLDLVNKNQIQLAIMTIMTREEWKKNDALLKVAFEKMKLNFKRNINTWEPMVFTKHPRSAYVDYFDADGELVIGGPTDPAGLGEVKYFRIGYRNLATICIKNIFFGVKSYEELKIQVDLLN